jgi:hypothetical protein
MFSYKVSVHKTLLVLVDEVEKLKKEIEELKGERKNGLL